MSTPEVEGGKNVERLGEDPELLAVASAPSDLELRGTLGSKRAREPAIRTGRLAGLAMWPAIWLVSWPVLAESFLNWAVGAVDTVLAAAISREAADAMGGGAYITWLMAMVGMSLGVGANALVARAVGKGRLAVANAAVGQAVLVAVALGAGIGVGVALLAPLFAELLGLSGEAKGLMVLYLRILALCAPAMTVLESCTACLRGAGDTRRPLLIMIVVNLLNIVISWSLAGVDLKTTSVAPTGETIARVVVHNPIDLHWGVTGIAVGTAIAYTLGAVLAVGIVVRGRGGVKLTSRRLRPHWHTLRRIVRIGLPNYFETLGMWAGNFLVVMMVGAMRSTGALGAHIVAIRIEAISFLPAFSMSLAAATLAGQWLGAGSPAMASRVILACVGVSGAFMGLMGACFILFPRTIAGWFTPQPEHLTLVPQLLFITGWVQIPFGIGIVLRSTLRAAGDAKVVMWITWISTWLIRLPLAFLISGVDLRFGDFTLHNPAWFGDNGLPGLWIGLCLEIVIRGAIFSARFLQGRWKTMKV